MLHQWVFKYHLGTTKEPREWTVSAPSAACAIAIWDKLEPWSSPGMQSHMWPRLTDIVCLEVHVGGSHEQQ